MQQVFYTLVFMTLFVLGLTKAETQGITHAKTNAKTKGDGEEKVSILLEKARDFTEDACIDCGRNEKSLAFLEVASNLISEVKKNILTSPESECLEFYQKPMDCSEVFRSGKNESGVYIIWPKSRITSGKPLKVYCDMDTDGGGWTVIQRRGNFTTPKNFFYRKWADYKKGFGDIREEFWIGNDYIHAISNQANYTIRFNLKDAAGKYGYAEYDNFWIDDESYEYTLHIQGYSGNVGDAMTDQSNLKFTTKDRKNDKSPGKNCAKMRQGAWWYDYCGGANLNGLYQPGENSWSSLYWIKWRSTHSLSGVEMKLRPHNFVVYK